MKDDGHSGQSFPNTEDSVIVSPAAWAGKGMGWFDVKELHKVERSQNGLICDLSHSNSKMRSSIESQKCTKRKSPSYSSHHTIPIHTTKNQIALHKSVSWS